MPHKVYVDDDNNFHKVIELGDVGLPNGTTLEDNVIIDLGVINEQEVEEWLEDNREEQ